MRALIAVDGSAAAEQAAAVADQILPVGADLALIDVVELSTPLLLGTDGTGALYAGQMLRDMEQRGSARAERDVASAARRLTDHDAEPLIDHGMVVERILDVAAQRAADLIVVGTGDRSWWDRIWHGSVSRRTALEASCSVLVVRSAAPVRRVLVAVDDSDPAERAAEVAARLRLDDVETVVITVAAGREPTPGAEGAGPPTAYELVSDVGDEIGADRFTVAVGDDPIDALVSAAEQQKADLVVVGTSDRGAMSRLFDESVSRGVLDRAPCSVLVARDASWPVTSTGRDTQEDR